MKRLGHLLLLCALGAALRAEAAEPQPRATILLLPFHNATGSADYAALERGIPDLLGALLSRNAGPVRVVERERLDAIAKEWSLGWQQYVTQDSLPRIGNLVQARYVVRGSVTKIGDRLHVQALVYETETTRLVTSAEVRGDPAAPIALCEELASKIAKSFPAGPGTVGLPADDDPERSLLMIHGLGHFYGGQYLKALPAFMKVVAKHPNDALARYWLARSFYEAGLRGDAAIELQTFLRSFPDHAKAAEASELLKTIQGGGRP